MELFEALINMKNGKSPGSDGLPAEFYKHFWYLIGDTFCNIVNRTLHYENELSSTQRLSIIKIFHKNGKEKTDLGNYRPISLLNTDYKIIAKTLANRLKKVLPYIIHNDQSFGIKGRNIQDNILLIKSLLDYIEQKNLGSIFLNVDQEKAFDRVSHKYLLLTLRKFGFGPKYLKWIKILYTNIESKISINGYLSVIIKILRSVRQGCPIAPLLYICVIETLLIKIRSHVLIRGIKSPTSNEQIKLSAFADDTSFFLKDIKSTEAVIHTFQNFGKASGARINKDKTVSIWLGEFKNRSFRD